MKIKPMKIKEDLCLAEILGLPDNIKFVETDEFLSLASSPAPITGKDRSFFTQKIEVINKKSGVFKMHSARVIYGWVEFDIYSMKNVLVIFDDDDMLYFDGSWHSSLDLITDHKSLRVSSISALEAIHGKRESDIYEKASLWLDLLDEKMESSHPKYNGIVDYILTTAINIEVSPQNAQAEIKGWIDSAIIKMDESF